MKPYLADILFLWKTSRSWFWICNVLLIGGFCLIGYALNFNKQDAAAWVQALGSIGAIVATWGLTTWQMKTTMRHDRQQQTANTCDQIDACLNMAKNLQELTNNIVCDLKTYIFDDIRASIGEWDALFSAFKALPAYEYPISLIAVDLVNMKNSLEDFRDYANKHFTDLMENGIAGNSSRHGIEKLGIAALDLVNTRLRSLTFQVTSQVQMLKDRAQA